MSDASIVTWLGLLGLGALHGLNPGMGWLFAVALGLQEKEGRAVWRALPPLALGHALAVAAVVAVVVTLGLSIPPVVLKWLVVALLATLGLFRLFRHAHPRYGGMCVNGRQLATWSFLMASAHGAGVMVLPFLVTGNDAPSADIGGHAHHLSALPVAPPDPAMAGFGGEQLLGLMVALVHTAGYLLVMGVLAILVYERLGLRMLRKAWINLDLIWSLALLGTAAATALL